MTTNEIFGRPIEGEIKRTKLDPPKQGDPMDLMNALDTLLALPGVIEYKWTQFTPYWNDGEECEFSTRVDWDAGVKLQFGDPYGGEADDGYYTDFRRWVRPDDNAYGGRFEYIEELNGIPVKPYADALASVSHEIGSSSHEVFLKETFGDHATIYATKEGFRVEFYDHE